MRWVRFYAQHGTDPSAPTPIDRTSTKIVARMAAKSSFRIQITSFAAQTSAAHRSEKRFNRGWRQRPRAPGGRPTSAPRRPRPSQSTSPHLPQRREIRVRLRTIRPAVRGRAERSPRAAPPEKGRPSQPRWGRPRPPSLVLRAHPRSHRRDPNRALRLLT